MASLLRLIKFGFCLREQNTDVNVLVLEYTLSCSSTHRTCLIVHQRAFCLTFTLQWVHQRATWSSATVACRLKKEGIESPTVWLEDVLHKLLSYSHLWCITVASSMHVGVKRHIILYLQSPSLAYSEEGQRIMHPWKATVTHICLPRGPQVSSLFTRLKSQSCCD